jgi:ABC-2 type transport system permease protein
LSLAIGNERGDVLGLSFITFLAPGLIAMSIIGQGFSHSVSSIMIAKIQGNIIDTLMAPLSAAEVTLAVILASVARGMIILIISVIVFSLIIEIHFHNILYIFVGSFLGSFILGTLGFITGQYALKFDHTAAVTNFIITPASFLSGVFYTTDKLPSFFQSISEWNPFFYIIDITRFGFIGVSDGSISFGLIYLTIIAFILWLLCWYLYLVGWKLKN